MCAVKTGNVGLRSLTCAGTELWDYKMESDYVSNVQRRRLALPAVVAVFRVASFAARSPLMGGGLATAHGFDIGSLAVAAKNRWG